MLGSRRTFTHNLGGTHPMKKMQETIVDDLDGTTPASPVTVSIDGDTFTVDLSPRNKAALLRRVEKFRNVARPTRTRPTGVPQPAESRTGSQSEIRAWARSNNIDVPSRGRLPRTIVERFEQQSA